MLSNSKFYIDELINKISLGRFSKANVNTALITKTRIKASNIFPIYEKLMTGSESCDTLPFIGFEPSKPYKFVTKRHALLVI